MCLKATTYRIFAISTAVFAGASAVAEDGRDTLTRHSREGRYAYVEVSAGYGGFSMHNLNTYYIGQYSPVFSREIAGGAVVDGEVGIFIADMFKVGISYVWTKGITDSDTTMEFTDRDTNTVEWNEWFLDSYYRGVGFGVRWYPVRMKRLRAYVGGKNTIGLARTHVGMGTRPEGTSGDYGYDNFSAKGVGLAALCGIELFLIREISIGLTTGYRILRTEVLRNVIDGEPWRRPPANPHNINLDFSGVFIQAKISLEI
jgi:hypothetical protein